MLSITAATYDWFILQVGYCVITKIFVEATIRGMLLSLLSTLKSFAHDMINYWYYEQLTDKQKFVNAC